jgi:hypothetical protein
VTSVSERPPSSTDQSWLTGVEEAAERVDVVRLAATARGNVEAETVDCMRAGTITQSG